VAVDALAVVLVADASSPSSPLQASSTDTARSVPTSRRRESARSAEVVWPGPPSRRTHARGDTPVPPTA
jgi:hypothetical protein